MLWCITMPLPTFARSFFATFFPLSLSRYSCFRCLANDMSTTPWGRATWRDLKLSRVSLAQNFFHDGLQPGVGWGRGMRS